MGRADADRIAARVAAIARDAERAAARPALASDAAARQPDALLAYFPSEALPRLLPNMLAVGRHALQRQLDRGLFDAAGTEAKLHLRALAMFLDTSADLARDLVGDVARLERRR